MKPWKELTKAIGMVFVFFSLGILNIISYIVAIALIVGVGLGGIYILVKFIQWALEH